jgi:hypothetical protein
VCSHKQRCLYMIQLVHVTSLRYTTLHSFKAEGRWCQMFSPPPDGSRKSESKHLIMLR